MEKIKPDIIYNELLKLYNNPKCALNYNNDFELLIAIILSAQTQDKAVNKVTPLLFSKYKTIDDLSNAKVEDVIEIIKPIGLAKSKSINIINTSKKLNELGLKTIPNDFDLLISLPGVGRKTTNVFLSEYYNEQRFGVDTHIYRISLRLGLREKEDSILTLENKLTKFFKNYSFKTTHHLLITFGRDICDSKKPKCDLCPFTKYCTKSD